MVENFLELVDILAVVPPSTFENSVDLTVEEDESFLLASGVVSHNSASSAFRKYRNPEFQGAFPLRGKVLNVAELPASKIVQNQEIKDLLTAIGLKMGEEPKDTRYGKILIYADADPDGDSITGLLINFFGRYWPELFQKERVFRVMTPLVVVERGTERHCFYTNAEFEKWSTSHDVTKWDVGYKKGLAALSDPDYEAIIKQPRMFALTPGPDMRAVLDCWFASDVKPRKAKILGEVLNGDDA